MHEPTRDSLLPPDLTDVSRYLRSDHAAAPAALLDRIVTTRARLEGGNRPPSTFADPPTQKPARKMAVVATFTGLAAAAVIMIVSSDLGRDGAQPSVLGATASGAWRAPTTAEAVSRLLQPWPAVAHAQTVARSQQARGPSAPLEPGAQARLAPSVRTYVRVLKDAGGRERSRTNLEVQLDWVRHQVDGHWLLRARLGDDPGSSTTEIDSIALETRTLRPVQRRLHTAGRRRYFRYSPTQVQATDTLPDYFFDETLVTSRPSLRSLWPIAPGRGYWYSISDLDSSQTLVLSEAHLQLLLRTLPLSRDWSMRVALVTLNERHFQRRAPTDLALRVTAIDTITTSIGTIPCYRMELDYGARPDIWWISVATGEFVRGVRTTADPVTTETTTLERVVPLPR
jgi:hypothetical protein